MTASARILLAALCASAAFTLLLTAAEYLNRPLRADEADWPPQAHAIVQHGVPRVSFAEDRVQHPLGYLGYDAHYGMWHPPLYQYVLSAGLLVLGDRDWMFRGVGLLCLAFTLLVIWRLAAEHLGAPPALRFVPVALPLLSPLVTEGSLVVDIDNSTLMASMTLLVWRFLRPGDPYSARRVVELSLLFCLTLLSKLTTPFVLMASLGLYGVLGARPRRAIVAIGLATIAGVALFAGLYYFYCWALSYPASFMWSVTYFGGKGDLYGSIKTMRELLLAVRWQIVWLSPIMSVLLAIVFTRRVRRYFRTRSVEPVDLLVIFSAATFFLYAGVGAMWGKYTVPAAAIGAAAVGFELARAWSVVQIERPGRFAAALAALAVLATTLPIPYVSPAAVPPGASLVRLLLDPRNLGAAAIGGAAVAFAVASAGRWIGGAPGHGAALALVGGLVVSTPIVTARVVMPGYDRGPLRPASDRGFRETAEFLNRTVPDAAVLAPKDVSRYYRGRVYPLDALVQAGGPALAAEIAERADVRAVVESAKYPWVSAPAFFEVLESRRADRVEIGDSVIYVKR